MTTGLREALEYALNQWQMYADAERGPGAETRDNSEPGADYLMWLTDGTDAEAQQYARCRAALALAQDPAQGTQCWACHHPSHGPGVNGSGCDECFCTQVEDIGGRPLRASAPAQEERPDIDEGRLARAIEQVHKNVANDLTRKWPPTWQTFGLEAEEYAAEYRALGVESHDQEPSGG